MRVKTARAYLLADKALHVARVYVLFFIIDTEICNEETSHTATQIKRERKEEKRPPAHAERQTIQ